jgi:hypothetical protein
MKEPSFWEDHVREIPVCQDLIANWRKIKEEVETYSSGDNSIFFIKYPEIRVDNPNDDGSMVNLYSGGDWKIATAGVRPDETMRAWGGSFLKDYVKNKIGVDLNDAISVVPSLLPTFNSIVKELEDAGYLFNAFVSFVSPGTEIAPHKGDARWMRIHLGLASDDNCIMRVGDEERTWVEGDIFAFKDGGPYAHSVSHKGDRTRVAIVFDIHLDYLRSALDVPML